MKTWLAKNWLWLLVDAAIILAGVLVLRQYVELPSLKRPQTIGAQTLRASGPATDEEWRAALTDSIKRGGDYMLAYQLSNGELAYQIDVLGGSQNNVYVSHVRLIAGSGTLYTVCRVTGDDAYCRAGDRALAHYSTRLIEREDMPGTCFYTENACSLGGNALFIDAIYRRWQATDSTDMVGNDLLDTALQLGENIAWLRNEDGSLIHSYDPHLGRLDRGYYVRFYPGESLMALLELYEMTDDPHWLDQARQTDEYMLRQEVTPDHWHAYGFSFFARLDSLTPDDIAYAKQIGQTILDDQEALTAVDNSIGIGTRVEALSSLARAFRQAGEPHAWLIPGLETSALFVMSHQLPDHACNWPSQLDLTPLAGGIYASCPEAYIRVDGLAHWINGAAGFLDYLDETGRGDT